MKIKLVILVFVLFALALPSVAKTYKSNYSVACSDLWTAVKDTLSQADHYAIQQSDDAQMHAEYDVKHEAHVTISGAILQRTNKVTLVPKGDGCEMQVVSNWSGVEHSDREDFKKRVDESLAKQKGPAAPPTEPAAPPK